jgi:hypothetical protein
VYVSASGGRRTEERHGGGPASAHIREVVLVGVAQVLEDRRRHLRRRRPVVLHLVHAEVVLDNVGHGLRVGRRPGPAAPDGVVHLRQLVRDAVGNVRAGGRARVGAEDDAVLERHRHDGRSEVDLSFLERVHVDVDAIFAELARLAELHLHGCRGREGSFV